MPTSTAVPTLPQSDWITQERATELLSHYARAEDPIDKSKSYFGDGTSMPHPMSWPEVGCIGRPIEPGTAPDDFEPQTSLSQLCSKDLFVCSKSAVGFSTQLEKVFFVDRSNIGRAAPSIIATVNGGRSVYVVRYEGPEDDIHQKLETMLGESKTKSCNWSTGNVDFHHLKVGSVAEQEHAGSEAEPDCELLDLSDDEDEGFYNVTGDEGVETFDDTLPEI